MDNSLRKETFYLYLIQVANFIIPLAAFPYLTHTLGVQGFGKLGFAQTVYFLCVFFIDFGFNLSGAKVVGKYRKSQIRLNYIYSNIQVVRILIYIFLLVILIPLLLSGWLDKIDSTLILIALISASGAVLTPNYVFNGLSSNSILALISILIKSIFLIPIFFFVEDVNDLTLAAILQMISGVVIGVVAQYFLFKRKLVKFSLTKINKRVIIRESKKSFDLFIASFFTLGFTYLTPILIKFTLGDFAVGLYSVVDRLITAMRQLYQPITQAFFSKVCVAYIEKELRTYNLLVKKVFFMFSVIGGVGLIGNILVGDTVLRIVFGKNYDIQGFLNIAILTQIIVSYASIIVNFIIIPIGKEFVLKKVYLFAVFVYFSVCWYLLSQFQLNGVFISMFFIELCILIYLVYYLCKEKVEMN
ncbi:oligosaccharide flippase family protein [Acinetobacter seifertii]|uniref:oligosaccharide flippase family protein n=1 Tax=Acinetobacter seifertii TaxID=1530123 RepID=UPI00168BA645|nr:oligosaccharide flippase family protein [Acinetobacter seifertii]MBU3084789.1 oligosaccharide flippase family protein [Acinetobacter seifertii]QNX60678.1 oligosaccharide flippase family protein [Acinetobacter seifertii]